MNSGHMNDPFEPTPEGFHMSVERKLNELSRARVKIKRPYRTTLVLAACLVLLGGTAVALDQLGVFYFLTDRTYMSQPVDEKAVAAATQQSCDSELLNASVRDAYWDGETLSLAINLSPKGDYAFYTVTDRGCDGESFDKIWWKGEILPYDEWLGGRKAVVLELPGLKMEGKSIIQSWDWVQDEQGETMLLQGRVSDMTMGAELTVELSSSIEGTDTKEKATLTIQLPPMEKGENKQ